MAFNLVPYTNFHDLNLDWILGRVKAMDEVKDDILASIDTAHEAITAAEAAQTGAEAAQTGAEAAQLAAEAAQNYAETAATNAGNSAEAAQDIVDTALDNIGDATSGAVADWLAQHVNPSTGYVVDKSLTIDGAAADARAVGVAVSGLRNFWKENYVNLTWNNYRITADGNITASTDYLLTDPIPVHGGIAVTIPDFNEDIPGFNPYYLYVALYSDENTFVSLSAAQSNGFAILADEGYYFRLMARYQTTATLTPANAPFSQIVTLSPTDTDIRAVPYAGEEGKAADARATSQALLELSIDKASASDLNNLRSNFNQIATEAVITGVNKNDGEYLTGVWTDINTFNNSSNYCRSKNPIPVSEGDVVRVVEEGDINYKGLALYSGDTLVGVTANGGTYSPTRQYVTIDGTGYYVYALTIPAGIDSVLYQRKITLTGIADMVTINQNMPTTYTAYVETDVFSMTDTFKGTHENISDFDATVLSLVNILKSKKVGFLGDSYTDVSYYYGSKIAEQTGMIAVANGKQGSRIFSDNSWTSGGQTVTVLSFWHRINDFVDADFNAICIFGGINDAQTRSIYETNLGTINDVALTTAQVEGGTVPTTFYQAYKTVIEMLWEKYPTLPLLIIIPPHQLDASYNPSQTSYMGIANIVAAEKAVAEFYGIPVCDLYKECQQLNNYTANVSAYRISSSNIHPNNAGQEAIAKLVKQSLEHLLS